MDSLSIYEADVPKFAVTDLVARDLLELNRKRIDSGISDDEETGSSKP